MGSFWDRCARLYDITETVNRRANNAMAQAVASWISPGSRVLDCAAGTGALTLAAARKAGSVLCTDLSPAMLDQAAKKAARVGAGHVSFQQRDIFSPGLEERFDAAIAGNVLHLLEKPELAVKRLLCAVHPGGRVVLPTYLLGETGTVFRVGLNVYRLFGFRPRHSYTLESYRAMLEDCGAKIICMKKLDGNIPVGFAVLRKLTF